MFFINWPSPFLASNRESVKKYPVYNNLLVTETEPIFFRSPGKAMLKDSNWGKQKNSRLEDRNENQDLNPTVFS